MHFKLKLLFILILLTTSCSLKTLKQTEYGEVQPALLKNESVILKNDYFIINYNKKHRLANWVKYELRKEDLNGPGKRPSKFKPDTNLIAMDIIPVVHDDYTSTGYARGHLAPAEDFSRSQDAISSTIFYFQKIYGVKLLYV